MVLLELTSQIAITVIQTTGYAGVIILMAMESMIFPVPSEAVMPFVGFLVHNGQMNLFLAILASSIGSVLGSGISYYIARYGGRQVLQKYGKYFLLNEKELEHTEKIFETHGSRAVFICRFIPVIRHIVSLPAGLAKMNAKKFFLYTVIGATIWNTILLEAGIVLENNWSTILGYAQVIDYIVIALIVLFVANFIFKKIQPVKTNTKKTTQKKK